MEVFKLKTFNSFLFQNHFFSLILAVFIALLSQISVAQPKLAKVDVVTTDMKTVESLFGLPRELDLIDAIIIDNIGRVNYLIESEVDVNLRREGKTALMWAAWIGNLDIVRALVEAEAELDLKDTRVGYTALINAVWMERLDVVEFLVSVKAKLDLRDHSGGTALMWAAWLGNWGIVRVLVEARSDISIQDNNGAMAIDYAVAKDHRYIANYLIEAGAKAGVGGFRGWVCRDFSFWCY